MLPLKWIAGIDYSMTCPAITIVSRDLQFSFANCQLRYLSDRIPKQQMPNIIGSRLGEYDSQEARFDAISAWSMDCIQQVTNNEDPETVAVFMEGYSMGSKGLVFNIAENTGVLKHKLWKAGHPITLVPPTSIKKFAFGKGNATKDQMHSAFVSETGVDLLSVYQPKAASVGSPTGDLVDSFYICKYGFVGGVIQSLNTAKG